MEEEKLENKIETTKEETEEQNKTQEEPEKLKNVFTYILFLITVILFIFTNFLLTLRNINHFTKLYSFLLQRIPTSDTIFLDSQNCPKDNRAQ